MATIGVDNSLPSGGFTVTYAPTDNQFLMDGIFTYTASAGDTVTELGFWQYNGSGGSVVEVGVYRIDTLALIVSGNITMGGNTNRQIVTVSTPLVAGVTYAVAYAVVSIVGAPDTIAVGSANAMDESVLTGSSPLANPFVKNGTQSGQYRTFFATVTPGATSPTVTAVNSGASIAEGATAVPVTGTNFASGMTAAITQPGASVAQTFTYVSATSGTFNLSMEPGSGNQLAFTDATYITDLDVTATGGTSAGFAITLVPANGQIFQTLASINATSAYRFTATPDLVVGDQVEGSGNSAGTAAIPAGLSFNNDATFTWANGATVVNFWVRAYDSVGKTWGAWALQSTPTNTGGGVSASAVSLSGTSNKNVGLAHVSGTLPRRTLH